MIEYREFDTKLTTSQFAAIISFVDSIPVGRIVLSGLKKKS